MRHTSGITYGGRGSTPVHKMYPAGSAALAHANDGRRVHRALGRLPLLHQPGHDVGLRLRPRRARPRRSSASPARRSGSTCRSASSEAARDGRHRLHRAGGEAEALRARRCRTIRTPASRSPFCDRTKPLKFECGGGCAVSTAADYMRFAQMLLNRGRARRHAHPWPQDASTT